MLSGAVVVLFLTGFEGSEEDGNSFIRHKMMLLGHTVTRRCAHEKRRKLDGNDFRIKTDKEE